MLAKDVFDELRAVAKDHERDRTGAVGRGHTDDLAAFDARVAAEMGLDLGWGD